MPKTKSKSKSRNRPGAGRNQRPDVPILPIVVGVIFAALLIAFFIYVRLNPTSTSSTESAKTINGIRCDTNEQLAFHIHDHLEITKGGVPQTIPNDIGRPSNCIYWLHTHEGIQGDEGVIHFEAPSDQAKHLVTLGDFFAVWGNSKALGDFKLSRTQVGGYHLAGNERLVVIVDGKTYDGDPASIVLNEGNPPKGGKLITLEILGPDDQQKPQTPFTFPQGE